MSFCLSVRINAVMSKTIKARILRVSMQILEIPAHHQPSKTVELDYGNLSYFILFFF